MLRIIQKRNYWFTISGIILVLAIFSLATWKLKPGIDFTGGSLLEVSYSANRPEVKDIKAALDPLELGSLIIQPIGETSAIIRFQNTGEEKHQAILEKLKNLSASNVIADATGQAELPFTELRYDSVGPSVGKQLIRKSITAVVIASIAILLYIAWAFRRISKPVASWKYGLSAVIAVLHDAIITIGVISIIGKFFNVEIDTSFIAAILTVLGFSVHDTIVVFDRIRENLPKSDEDFENAVNSSINRTLARSINTTLVTMLSLLAIIIFGGSTIKGFALVLLVGFFFGAYSSIFLASPMLVIWEKMKIKNS